MSREQKPTGTSSSKSVNGNSDTFKIVCRNRCGFSFSKRRRFFNAIFSIRIDRVMDTCQLLPCHLHCRKYALVIDDLVDCVRMYKRKVCDKRRSYVFGSYKLCTVSFVKNLFARRNRRLCFAFVFFALYC